MSNLSKFKKTKTCPRCDEKCDITTKICPDCGLNFSKLSLGSNKLAKKNILKGNKDAVVYNRAFPKDVKKYKVLLLSIFLGIFGAHNLYVGRFLKGFYMFICGILTIACVAFTSYSFIDTLLAISTPFIGVMAIMWLWDIFDIVFDRYKIPISIDVGEIN